MGSYIAQALSTLIMLITFPNVMTSRQLQSLDKCVLHYVYQRNHSDVLVSLPPWTTNDPQKHGTSTLTIDSICHDITRYIYIQSRLNKSNPRQQPNQAIVKALDKLVRKHFIRPNSAYERIVKSQLIH